MSEEMTWPDVCDCGRCGAPARWEQESSWEYSPMIICANGHYLPSDGFESIEEQAASWNERQIEDALRSELAELRRRVEKSETELRWMKVVVEQLPAGVWQTAIDAFTDEANREIAEAMAQAADADPDNEFIQMAAAAYRQEPQP